MWIHVVYSVYEFIQGWCSKRWLIFKEFVYLYLCLFEIDTLKSINRGQAEYLGLETYKW